MRMVGASVTTSADDKQGTSRHYATASTELADMMQRRKVCATDQVEGQQAIAN